VWPNTVVTEDVLKRCIGELRRAFEDDARDPRIIETISKRGYRLAVALMDSGKAAEADAVYCEMQARARREYVAPTSLALAAVATAREDEALCHAREACEIRDPNCQGFFSRHFAFAPRLYHCPGFREIIVQMGRSDWLRDPFPLTVSLAAIDDAPR
jgi:hypothetical protein